MREARPLKMPGILFDILVLNTEYGKMSYRIAESKGTEVVLEYMNEHDNGMTDLRTSR